jgi:hypothetical protein
MNKVELCVHEWEYWSALESSLLIAIITVYDRNEEDASFDLIW